MTKFASLLCPSFSRRDTLIGGAALLAALAFNPALSLAEGPAKIPTMELYAPQALPDLFLGKADAPVTIVEYASLTCSHCAAFNIETMPSLKKNYIDTGKVRFVLREFPLDALATGAAMLARCSGDKREAVVELLFAQQRNWAFVDKPLEALEGVMKQTGMSSESFKKCLEDKSLYQNVLNERQTASDKFGVTSTPTFFINGERKVGEIPVADLDKLIAAQTPK